ncbi:serine/threonine-protein kinase/endoribonuclease IRE1a-like [Prosopis cineraria]|uniref:serine/threonine-protein kinase/endoribonuclease IRE1a-like n=1 Tax=Prosopis cineraria TaxID=364024 RepID=UPI0024101AA9|nr:serine/threonine-protein kinase/endoribonuclease IRE1a-like [Prosopis cineraria]
MKFRLFRITRFMLWLIPLLWNLTCHVLTLESSQVSPVDRSEQGFDVLFPPLSRPSRSILSFSTKPSTTLVASLDGTIYLVEIGSMRVIWSFSTGSPIYHSYQAPLIKDNVKENVCGLDSGFIECGDDWALYMESKHSRKMRLPISVADFVAATPTFSDDGGVILGSKRITLFEVDAISGKLIRSYAADNLSALSSNDMHSVTNIVRTKDKDLGDPAMPSTPELLLKIIRTDYSLQGVGPRSGKVLWTMNVAEFKASLFCGHNENLYAGVSLDSEDKYVSNNDLDFAMPYACHELEEVHRLRKNLLFGDLTESLPGDYHDKKMLPVPTSDLRLLPQSNLDTSLNQHVDNMALPTYPNVLPSLPQNLNPHDNHDNAAILSQPPTEISARGEVDGNKVIEWPRSSLLLFLLLLLGLLMYHLPVVKRLVILVVRNGGSEIKGSPLKKKRARKSGKKSGNGDKGNKNLSSEDEGVMASGKIAREALPHVEKVEGAEGRQIGKLFVSNKEIAMGSNGTIVLEGMYEGRAVAIKRLVLAHYDIADKEIQNLIASDHHPNIVRWHGVERDQDFIYLALERCVCNLGDLIQVYSDSSSKPMSSKNQSSECLKVQIEMGNNNIQELWKANGYPSSLLLKLMRDIVSGLVHLHELGIIHRDLKPQNILITKERHLGAKVSDMGISKRLLGDKSSFSHNGTGCGSSGWQAPEQIDRGRQTRAVDLFSLGCLLFFCITKGRHPFGKRLLERDFNIVKDRKDLSPVEFIPEAKDLVSSLLNPTPESRPKAIEVLRHPFFWSSEMRLSFLRDASDRVELEDRLTGSSLLMALESIAPEAFDGANWDKKIEPAFIADIGRYRRYKFGSVRDLLRVMRNKLNHYRELPQEIQELLGPVPEGFNEYFASRFPKLLIKVYKIVHEYCEHEECFNRYFQNVD